VPASAAQPEIRRTAASGGGISMNSANSALIWDGNWAWSLPVVVFNVLFHVIGLGLIRHGLIGTVQAVTTLRKFAPRFALVMGLTTLMATLLHAMEAASGPDCSGRSVPYPMADPRCSIR